MWYAKGAFVLFTDHVLVAQSYTIGHTGIVGVRAEHYTSSLWNENHSANYYPSL
jgi:hypothetical protein